MINPNRIYKSTDTYMITKIHDKGGNNSFAVTANGATFEGWLDRLSNTKSYQRFNENDLVKIGLQYSIMLDRWVVRAMTKIRQPAPR